MFHTNFFVHFPYIMQKIINRYKHPGFYVIIWKRCANEYKKNIYINIFQQQISEVSLSLRAPYALK